MAELTLITDSSWMSPWSFHALVALEEKQLPYHIETIRLPMPPERRTALERRAVMAQLPVLAHRPAAAPELWIAESLAISEYLAERFPTPAHPRLFPADLGHRARARQLMLVLRTELGALQEERPTSTVFGRPSRQALSERARREADELIRITIALLTPGAPSLFGDWCIADADLSLALMRLIANEDPVPDPVVQYALAQWDRASVKKFAAQLPTTH